MEARIREIFQPYQTHHGELDRRRQAGRPTALIAMHSFTPLFMGRSRGRGMSGCSTTVIPVLPMP